MLFALYLEPLCLSVIRSSNVRDFSAYGNEVKVLTYEGDLAFFRTDLSSIKMVVSTIGEFGKISGARMNFAESLGLCFGP